MTDYQNSKTGIIIDDNHNIGILSILPEPPDMTSKGTVKILVVNSNNNTVDGT